MIQVFMSKVKVTGQGQMEKWFPMHNFHILCHILNKVGPTTPMLHTKSQSHWPSGSGEDFLPYMGVAAVLVMWPGLFEQTFVPTS